MMLTDCNYVLYSYVRLAYLTPAPKMPYGRHDSMFFGGYAITLAELPSSRTSWPLPPKPFRHHGWKLTSYNRIALQ